MLTKAQIQRLREGFNMLDVDSDSQLSKQDLISFMESIGSPYTEQEINEMIEELQPNPTFITLITIIGERLSEIANEEKLMEWMKTFDEDNDGLVESDLFKFWMTEKGNKMNLRDYEYLIRGCEDKGKISIRRLASKMKYGEAMDGSEL